MGCDKKCVVCREYFTEIAHAINQDMEYDSDDSDYFVAEDVISGCDCNDGTMCIDCHDEGVL